QSRPYGVGHSLGGTALLLAEAMRPGTFAAIYCYEPILLAAADRRPLGSPNPMSEAARRRRASFSSRAEVLERYRSRPPLSSLHPDVLARYVEHGFEDVPDGTVLLRCRPESEALVFESGFASDALDHLDGVLCPVTLATGADSGDLARSGVSHVLERLANGRAVELGGLGHLGPMESPSAVAGSVLAAFAALG
ncbi:MAG: putative hydrolase or acyltransferase of alpha/beta superfamily, partial [Acidimicrobiaceae bacterium]|nr:putative hydrolase or acyltransferase of alpha/beta superfamily [Acidimicrobiaceae bacterium]